MAYQGYTNTPGQKGFQVHTPPPPLSGNEECSRHDERETAIDV